MKWTVPARTPLFVVRRSSFTAVAADRPKLSLELRAARTPKSCSGRASSGKPSAVSARDSGT